MQKQFQQQMPDIYYTYLSRDRNQGISLAEGEDIFFEDSGLASFLRYSTYNGEIISALAHHLVKFEKIKKILFIRTPSTGGWIEKLEFDKMIDVEKEYYFDQQQHEPKSSSSIKFSKRQHFELEMQKKIQSGLVFDLILIDGFHDFHTSFKDFELCFNCLAQDGILLSHDCAPTSPEMAEPKFKPGRWCGCTYASLITYAASNPDLALTILDTDTGIGIGRRHSSKLRTRWLRNPKRPDTDIQSEFLSLVSASEFKKAYSYFRHHASSLADFKSIWSKS